MHAFGSIAGLTQNLQVARSELSEVKRHPVRGVVFVMLVALRDNAVERKVAFSSARCALPLEDTHQNFASHLCAFLVPFSHAAPCLP
jgi:hypothetical protein